MENFRPTPEQAVSALALIAAGFASTILIGRIGRETGNGAGAEVDSTANTASP